MLSARRLPFDCRAGEFLSRLKVLQRECIIRLLLWHQAATPSSLSVRLSHAIDPMFRVARITDDLTLPVGAERRCAPHARALLMLFRIAERFLPRIARGGNASSGPFDRSSVNGRIP